jgi:hypothetical protein
MFVPQIDSCLRLELTHLRLKSSGEVPPAIKPQDFLKKSRMSKSPNASIIYLSKMVYQDWDTFSLFLHNLRTKNWWRQGRVRTSWQRGFYLRNDMLL